MMKTYLACWTWLVTASWAESKTFCSTGIRVALQLADLNEPTVFIGGLESTLMNQCWRQCSAENASKTELQKCFQKTSKLNKIFMCILLTSIIQIFISIYVLNVGILWLTANGKIFPVFSLFCMDRYGTSRSWVHITYPEKKKAGIP